jgi:hypothetical protein
MNSISTEALNLALSGHEAPLLLDVRRAAARSQSGQQIPGALWRDPALWLDWKDEIAARGPVVTRLKPPGQPASGFNCSRP